MNNVAYASGLLYDRPAPPWWKFWATRPQIVGQWTQIGNVVSVTGRLKAGPGLSPAYYTAQYAVSDPAARDA